MRKDSYAETRRIQVEVDKEPENQGKYLNPEAYGKGEADGINTRTGIPLIKANPDFPRSS